MTRHICTVDWSDDDAGICEGVLPEAGVTVTLVSDYVGRAPSSDWEISLPAGITGIVKGGVREWHDVVIELPLGELVWVSPEFLTWSEGDKA